jgi:hypothetical protein
MRTACRCSPASRCHHCREVDRKRQEAAGMRYGAFVWTGENRYPVENALRVFAKYGIAERWADTRGLVVRPVWVKEEK